MYKSKNNTTTIALLKMSIISANYYTISDALFKQIKTFLNVGDASKRGYCGNIQVICHFRTTQQHDKQTI